MRLHEVAKEGAVIYRPEYEYIVVADGRLYVYGGTCRDSVAEIDLEDLLADDWYTLKKRKPKNGDIVVSQRGNRYLWFNGELYQRSSNVEGDLLVEP